jgi:hypothetical protein
MYICVLLIGLVLYNPFVALAGHSDGLTYQALARHRATVGASEMQHFSPIQGESAQREATVQRICIELVVEKTAYPSPTFQVESLPQRPELASSVWFRPPPRGKYTPRRTKYPETLRSFR